MPSKKILIVDDEPDILKVVSYRLKKMGYNMLLAVNGQEGLDMAEKERPDLILLDLRLPMMDGYEVCRRLKANKELDRIPIILLSASQATRIKEKLTECKADDYIVKPFELKELLDKIERFIG
jgi:two-component system alkaline phosphatase synthesis response regulator PhoP